MKDNNEVKIVNIKQVRTYTENGYQPIRIENGFNDKLVFVYDKKETEQIFYDWINHRFEEDLQNVRQNVVDYVKT